MKSLIYFTQVVLALTFLEPSVAQSSGIESSRLYFEKTDRSPIVNLALVLKSGGVQDPVEKQGLSNFVGEMLLRGTRVRSKAEFERKIDELGAEIAVEVRAEALIIRCAVLEKKIEPFLALLKEAITEQVFSAVEIEKLRSELLSGLNDMKARDGRLAQELLPHLLFPEHPYGHFLMGHQKSLKSIQKKDIQQHYQALFHRTAFTLVGNGPVTPARMEEWFRELNQKLPEAPQKQFVLSNPASASQRHVYIIDKPDRTQTQVIVAQKGALISSDAFFPLHVGNFAFGGGSFSSRLMQEIRVKRGWSYGAGSNFRFGTRERSWSLSLMPKTEDTVPALKHVLTMLDDLKMNGITESEFGQAQASLANGAAFTSNTPEKRIENRVLEITLDLPLGYMDTWKKRILETKLSNVKTELGKFIAPEGLTIVILATKTPELLAGIEAATGVKSDQIKVIRYDQAF